MFKLAALYHFVEVESVPCMRKWLIDLSTSFKIQGALILANEGINGTVAGSPPNIDSFISSVAAHPKLNGIEVKYSFADSHPFYRMNVKVKPEIVTMGLPELCPGNLRGTYVEPEDWNELITNPDVTLVDTRNDYEFNLGTFRGAVNPDTKSFKEFPEFVKSALDPSKHKKVAMFCTGGIRCEKSTSYLRSQGFEEVYHLKGVCLCMYWWVVSWVLYVFISSMICVVVVQVTLSYNGYFCQKAMSLTIYIYIPRRHTEILGKGPRIRNYVGW